MLEAQKQVYTHMKSELYQIKNDKITERLKSYQILVIESTFGYIIFSKNKRASFKEALITFTHF
ncbi:hypothetical protein AMD00_17065 [Viridibacillus arvi]|uniref:Uncharacterized protein n=1 Tax=Viridibacillus arvi TaxID=263475 RepID=A0A0M0LGI4_9BACL|nr:hypothetical protein AMD00_17065 [Viridibacillus arvi]